MMIIIVMMLGNEVVCQMSSLRWDGWEKQKKTTTKNNNNMSIFCVIKVGDYIILNLRRVYVVM